MFARFYVFSSGVVLATAVSALAVDFTLDDAIDEFIDTDTTTGSSVVQDEADPRRMTFAISDPARSRAEIRRASQTGGRQAMGGTFTLLDDSGDFLSIIQVLNVKTRGKPSGPSEPVAQLAIRKTGDYKNVGGEMRATYEFYIEQQSGKPACTALGMFTRGEAVTLSMSYGEGQWPVFQRDGDPVKTCTSGKPDRVVGKPTGKAGGAYYYYGKLGIYKTNRGTGAATAMWASIYD